MSVVNVCFHEEDTTRPKNFVCSTFEADIEMVARSVLENHTPGDDLRPNTGFEKGKMAATFSFPESGLRIGEDQELLKGVKVGLADKRL